MLAKHIKNISVLLFCLMVGVANAEILAESKLSCKITDQVVIGSKDGKAQRFIGYEGAYSKGDTLNLVLELEKWKSGEGKYANTFYQLDVILKSQDTPWFSLFVDIDKNTRVSDIAGVSMLSGSVEPIVAFMGEMKLKKNELFVWDNLGRISLERYYKDDWSGVWSRYDFNSEYATVGTVTLDCKTDTKTTIGDLYDNVVDIYQSLNQE